MYSHTGNFNCCCCCCCCCCCLCYTFSSIGTNPYFDIDPVNGTIFTKSTPIDRETDATYQVTVTVTDLIGLNDQTDLIICVCDENDNNPIFTSTFDIYRSTIDEVLPTGHTFYTTIRADDADERPEDNLDCGCPVTNNAVLEYSKTGGDNRFSVNSETGKI